MFENIIAQEAASQLHDDIRSEQLAPSMLFYGPAASGKGSAALEFARAGSCEQNAAWNCACPSCVRHRYLVHGDLLMLGPRAFSAEIAASRAALLRETSAAQTKLLFIRSVRKLTARFNPALWEDDPKLGKISPLLLAIEEGLAEFENLASGNGEEVARNAQAPELEKASEALLKNAVKLESDCFGENIPIAQIRRAAYWSRLAPSGRRKTLIIENAERMQEGARNSLLKLLEEPPATITIILTAHRRETIMPTLLSRLRPYRFLGRTHEQESEVIRRVFRDTAAAGTGLASYLDSFLPQSNEKLYSLAAFFVASVTRAAVLAQRKSGGTGVSPELAATGAYCAPIAEAAGFQKAHNAADVCDVIIAESSNFQARSFPRFLKLCLDLVSLSAQKAGAYPGAIAYNEIWRENVSRADTAVGMWNQSPALALEMFFQRAYNSLGSRARA